MLIPESRGHFGLNRSLRLGRNWLAQLSRKTPVLFGEKGRNWKWIVEEKEEVLGEIGKVMAREKGGRRRRLWMGGEDVFQRTRARMLSAEKKGEGW